MKKTIKYTQVKTFIFETKNKPYNDDDINKWLFENRAVTEDVEIVWDIQDTYVLVTIAYVKKSET